MTVPDFASLVEAAVKAYESESNIIDKAISQFQERSRKKTLQHANLKSSSSEVPMKAYLSMVTGDSELLKALYSEARDASKEGDIEQFKENYSALIQKKWPLLSPPPSLYEEQIDLIVKLAVKAYQAPAENAASSWLAYASTTSKILVQLEKKIGRERYSAELLQSKFHEQMVKTFKNAENSSWLEIIIALDEYKESKKIVEILDKHQKYLMSFYLDIRRNEKGEQTSDNIEDLDEESANAQFVYEKAKGNSSNVEEFSKSILLELNDLFYRSKNEIQRSKSTSPQAAVKELYRQIEKIKRFGDEIRKDYPEAAKGVSKLADNLIKKIDSFLNKPERGSKEEVAKFTSEFEKLLHSEEARIKGKLLNSWQPLVANILFAFTLVGFFAIGCKAVYNTLKNDEKLSLRSGFFWTNKQDESQKAKFEKLTDEIDVASSNLPLADKNRPK